MVTIKKITPMPKPLCTKAIPKIMGVMRDFLSEKLRTQVSQASLE
jgi:hypothetical protein